MSEERGQYQVRGDLPEEKYDSLKEDIRENGVEVPVVLDEDENIIDGHHRVRICEELGIDDYPTEVNPDLEDDDAKRKRAWALNAKRRNERAIDLAKDYLRSDYDGETQKEVADFLGVGTTTVRRAVKELWSEENHQLVDLPATQDQKREAIQKRVEQEGDDLNVTQVSKDLDVDRKTVRKVRDERTDNDDKAENVTTVPEKTETTTEETTIEKTEGEFKNPLFDDDAPLNEFEKEQEQKRQEVIDDVKESVKSAEEELEELMGEDERRENSLILSNFTTLQSLRLALEPAEGLTKWTVDAPRCPKCETEDRENIQFSCCDLTVDEAYELMEEKNNEKQERISQRLEEYYGDNQ